MPLVELNPVAGFLPRNPAMGWAIYVDQDGTTLQEGGPGKLLDADEYWKAVAPALPHANQLYIRLPWSEFEPEEGRYAWEHNPRFIGLIDGARQHGLRLSFRWYTDGRDCHRQATPEYVRAAGAAGDTLLPAGRPGPLEDGRWWWTPWSDDPVLHNCLERFATAFAVRFDDVSITDYVDHGLGRWGEMHSFVFAEMGRYHDLAPQVLARMARMHRRVFQHVLRCHNFGGWDMSLDLEDEVLLSLDHCIRRDGLGSPRYFNRSECELLSSYWPRVPVFGENCYWHWDSNPNWIRTDGYETRRACLEQVFADAKAVHANTLDLRTPQDLTTWLSEAPDLVEEFRREGGYGLLPTVLDLPERLPPAGQRFRVRHLWRNIGWGVLPNRAWGGRVAPALALLDDGGNPAAVFVSDADPGEWIAGRAYHCGDDFSAPALAPGVYRWAVALVDRFRDNQPWIALAVEGAKPQAEWLPLELHCRAE